MDANFGSMFLDALNQHLAPGAAWLPLAGGVFALIAGLVFLVKGARLAPVLAAIVFAGAGGVAGGVASQSFGLPLWPTVVVAGTIGLALGLVLFKLWFALLVAGCLASAALSLYGGSALTPALRNYQTRGLQAGVDGPEVTLPAPVQEGLARLGWQAELASLWTYLGEQVPAFHTSFFAILITTGLAGLIFALLLPKAARAFWAATVGVGLFLPALYGLLRGHWPAGAAFVAQWNLLIAAVMWSISLLYNLADVLNWSPRKLGTPAAKAAPAG